MPERTIPLTFDALGTPLRDVTFVVVDLETTGGAPVDAGITEIGAVKIRGGEVIGEFRTFANPGTPVPPFISVLTGITSAMVAEAPRVSAALAAFLAWADFDGAEGPVLVAHNAPYDVGFLKGACAKADRAWPAPRVVDTARIARAALGRDEVPNAKLATLAAHFQATVSPNHRALDDARATVDVLHALLARLGNLGVHSLEELMAFSSRVTSSQRRKRSLAEGLPEGPGVYLFRDKQDRVLYVGTSRNVRTRVRTYFTASEQRSRMAEMVGLAERVDAIACATTLEAQVRELRLIAEHRPRYNRRSTRPEAAVWLKLTDEPFPRLSVVREVRNRDVYSREAFIGPFPGRRAAQDAAEALLAAIPLRTCTSRLPARASSSASACVLAELGRCSAPCVGATTTEDYATLADAARAAMTGDARPVVAALETRMGSLADVGRYEDAAVYRERLARLVDAASRSQRLGSLAGLREFVAAQTTATGAWEIHVIRHGRLAGAAVSEPGVDPRPIVEALVATAEAVALPTGTSTSPTAALTEETERILHWLDGDGTRLVRLEAVDGVEQGWLSPAHAAGAVRARLRAARVSAPVPGAHRLVERRVGAMAARPPAAVSRIAN
jgi:DNA polymerase-3 subunit epsilon